MYSTFKVESYISFFFTPIMYIYFVFKYTIFCNFRGFCGEAKTL